MHTFVQLTCFKSRANSSVFCLLITLCVIASFNVTASPLQLLYLQRAPFSFESSDSAKGIIVDLMKEVSDLQGVPVHLNDAKGWINTLNLLKSGINACYLGAYWTEDRAKQYKFSESIFQETPYIVVANKQVKQRFGSSVSLDELLTSDFVFGTQNGFSYGAVIDQKVVRYKTKTLSLSYLTTKAKNHSERNVFSLLNLGRIDYVLLNADEYYWNLANSISAKPNITELTLDDALPGQHRYLMCDQQVSNQTIEQLNRGIEKLKTSGRYQSIVNQYTQ